MSKNSKSGAPELFAIVKHTGSLRNHELEVYNVSEIKQTIGPREEGGKPRRKYPYKPKSDKNFDPVMLYELKTRRGAVDQSIHTYRVYILLMSGTYVRLRCPTGFLGCSHK